MHVYMYVCVCMCVCVREGEQVRQAIVKGIQVNNINFIDDDNNVNIRKLTPTVFRTFPSFLLCIIVSLHVHPSKRNTFLTIQTRHVGSELNCPSP